MNQKSGIILKKSYGFTLVEVLISLFILLILTLGIYSLITISLNLTSDNKNYVEAIYIANQKMEIVRNLPYDSVGVVGGIPSGSIPQEETVARAGTYIVNTYVRFYDDPFDGQAGSTTPDTIPTDYKIVTIKVGWQSKIGQKNVTIFSKVIPRTEETLAGYGLLKIFVTDANGAALTGANVRVVNSLIATSVDVTNLSDTAGLLYLPAPASFQGYKVIVSKDGYSTDQTYPITASNTQPTKANLSVTAGNKTEESFAIDRLATLRVKTISSSLPANWLVNQLAAGVDIKNPKISIGESDNIYFTWQSTTATSSAVYVQKYNSSAVRQWASDKKIYTASYQINPGIASAQNGNTFVVWQDNSLTLKKIAAGQRANLLAEKNKTRNEPLLKNFGFNVQPGTKSWLAFFNQIKNKAAGEFNLFFKKISWLKNNLLALFQNTPQNAAEKIFARNVEAAMDTVVYVGAGPANNTGNTSSISLSVPAGVQAGDLLIAYIHHDDYSDGPMDPPAGMGWNTLNNNIQPSGSSHNDSRGGIFWKIVAGGDPASYTFTLHSGNNEQKAGYIRAYRGTDQISPFDGTLTYNTTDTGNVLRPAPSKTVSNNNSMLICGWGADTPTLGNVAGGPTFPAGMSHSINNNNIDIGVTGADQSVSIADSPTGNKNYDAKQIVDEKSVNWSLVIKPAVLPDNATVSARGSQTPSMVIGSTGQYLGGSFVINDNTGSRNINQITLTETGTVDAKNNLSNVKLFYDYDTSAPYDCASEQYNAGSDAQFGSASSFSTNSTSTFSAAGVTISTTKALCLYAVFDVGVGASKNDTVKITINNPSVDVIASSGNIIPASSIEIPNSTTLLAPANMKTIHYRWRNNDGSEASATWKESQDAQTSAKAGDLIRLRFEVTNIGSLTSATVNYRLEYGEKQTACANIATWNAVPIDDSLHWKIADSANLTDNTTTTNASGLIDENTTFIPGAVKDASNDTSGITLTSSQFTEIEYSLNATLNAEDKNYCFRLTNAGSTADFTYAVYPEISLIGDDNVYIVGLDANGNNLWTVKQINSDIGFSEQSKPVIALTDNFGTATSVVAWEDARNGNYDIYAQSFDASGNKLWASDLAVATSSVDELTPAISINSDDEILIAWTAGEADGMKIYAQKFNLQGIRLWPANISIASSTLNNYSPAIAAGSGGKFYSAWTEDSGADKNVNLAGFNSGGAESWLKAANLESSAYDQYQPGLISKNDIVYVSWTDKRETNEDIYTQKYNASGTAQWTNDYKININTDASAQNNPVLAINSTGSPYGAWADSRNSTTTNIYATQFGDPGTPVSVPNVPITVYGTKRIGENPVILKYNIATTTDAGGARNFTVEWDSSGYTVSTIAASTSLRVIYANPLQPMKILPGEDKTLLIYVQ